MSTKRNSPSQPVGKRSTATKNKKPKNTIRKTTELAPQVKVTHDHGKKKGQRPKSKFCNCRFRSECPHKSHYHKLRTKNGAETRIARAREESGEVKAPPPRVRSCVCTEKGTHLHKTDSPGLPHACFQGEKSFIATVEPTGINEENKDDHLPPVILENPLSSGALPSIDLIVDAESCKSATGVPTPPLKIPNPEMKYALADVAPYSGVAPSPPASTNRPLNLGRFCTEETATSDLKLDPDEPPPMAPVDLEETHDRVLFKCIEKVHESFIERMLEAGGILFNKDYEVATSINQEFCEFLDLNPSIPVTYNLFGMKLWTNNNARTLHSLADQAGYNKCETGEVYTSIVKYCLNKSVLRVRSSQSAAGKHWESFSTLVRDVITKMPFFKEGNWNPQKLENTYNYLNNLFAFRDLHRLATYPRKKESAPLFFPQIPRPLSPGVVRFTDGGLTRSMQDGYLRTLRQIGVYAFLVGTGFMMWRAGKYAFHLRGQAIGSILGIGRSLALPFRLMDSSTRIPRGIYDSVLGGSLVSGSLWSPGKIFCTETIKQIGFGSMKIS